MLDEQSSPPTTVLPPTGPPRTDFPPTTGPPQGTTATTGVANDDGVTVDAKTGDGGIGLAVAVVLCLVVAVVAGLIGWFAGSRRADSTEPQTSAPRPSPPRPAERAAPTQTPTSAEPVEVVDPARKQLIDGIIAVRDLVDNRAVSDRLGQLLDSVGVSTIDPVGVRFDPSEHQAQAPPILVGDRALDGVIAEVVSLGYGERGAITRFPVVVIYRYSESVE